MIEAVIFDVDGTLVDSVDLHAECWKQAFEKFDRPVPFDQVRRLIGKGGDQLIPSILSAEDQKAFGEELDAFRSKLWKKDFASKVKPFPCVRELFLALKKQNVRIALGSSAKKQELETYEKLVNVQDLVDVRATSDDAELSKPAPDIFEAVMAKLRTDPKRTRVIGDTPYDVRAATRASLETVAVLCGGFPQEELLAVGAKAVFRDPCELLSQLDRWAGGQ
ncbi:MAG: HAD family hydrolase [Myxococcaceae bacterium]